MAGLVERHRVTHFGASPTLIRGLAANETRALAGDLAYLKTVLVNVYFAGPPGAGDREWVLVDAGIPGQAGAIAAAAARRFQPGARPAAIVLTHGHFDHVGSLRLLAERWDVPVFAADLFGVR